MVPISVDFRNFSPYNNDSDEDIKLFYGGSFAEKDSIDILLDAFEIISKIFTNVKIVMTGIGMKRHMEKFYELIEKNTSKDRIFYKGCIPIKEYYSTLNNCDIMCLTRSNSAFANGGFPLNLVNT